MSDRMRPIPFKDLLNQIMTEFKQKGTIFYVPVTKIELVGRKILLSGKQVESPVGPAAGPHTQLAQNIVAAYVGGARYFELKTVQILDSEELGLQKPCIYVNGEEAYNTEWSSELNSYQALEEYIKAWILIKLLIQEFQLGDENGFVFNMSVGYSLEGIQTEKIDYFLEHMKDASSTAIFQECIDYCNSIIEIFSRVTKEYIQNLDSRVCNTVSLSTMHGCPIKEIEYIATYLLEKKKLNTYLKCNPTLLGYEEIKNSLETMGYDYVSYNKEGFDQDISFEAAVTLIQHLQLVAQENQLEFGVKLTNTFPVNIKGEELPGDTMYMSGPSLYPISIGVAAKLANVLGDSLRISYSGGADNKNIAAIYETGICPITVSTYLLKPGGYKNLKKLNQALIGHEPKNENHLDIEKLNYLTSASLYDKQYFKKTTQMKKLEGKQEDALFCSKCRNCIDVCPNRAKFLVEDVKGKYILHLDAYCNECGNCTNFCSQGYQPYKDKFTIFPTEEDFYDSVNSGIYQGEEDWILRMSNQVTRGRLEVWNEVPERLREWLMLPEEGGNN